MAKKEVVQLRCTVSEKERWNEAAKAQGLELSPWIRWILDREVSGVKTPTAFPMTFDLDE